MSPFKQIYILNFIGNIVTTKRFNSVKYFNICTSPSDCISDIPTLYIGLETARENIIDFNILNKRPTNNIWWTYGRTENRKEQEEDIQSFTDFCINRLLNKVKYKYIDILNLTYSRIKKMVYYFTQCGHKKIFITRGSMFMFIYVPRDECVYGLSLSLCEYFHIPNKKIIKRFAKLPDTDFVHSTDFIDDEIRSNTNNNPHLIPIFSDFFGE